MGDRKTNKWRGLQHCMLYESPFPVFNNLKRLVFRKESHKIDHSQIYLTARAAPMQALQRPQRRLRSGQSVLPHIEAFPELDWDRGTNHKKHHAGNPWDPLHRSHQENRENDILGVKECTFGGSLFEPLL